MERIRGGRWGSHYTMLNNTVWLLIDAVKVETGCSYDDVRAWMEFARENLDGATLRPIVFFLVGRRFLSMMKEESVEAFEPVGQGDHQSSKVETLYINSKPFVSNIELALLFLDATGVCNKVVFYFPVKPPEFFGEHVAYSPQKELRQLITENPGATKELLQTRGIDLCKLSDTDWITSPTEQSVKGTSFKRFEGGRLGSLSRLCKNFAFRDQNNHAFLDRTSLVMGMHMARCVWNVLPSLIQVNLLPEKLRAADMYGVWKYLVGEADDRVLANIGFASLASRCSVCEMKDHIIIPKEFNKLPRPVPLYYGVNVKDGASIFNANLEETPEGVNARVSKALEQSGQSPTRVQFHQRPVADFGWHPTAPCKITRNVTYDADRFTSTYTLSTASDPTKVFSRAKKIQFPPLTQPGERPIGPRKLQECLRGTSEWSPFAEEISKCAQIPKTVAYAYINHPHARMVGSLPAKARNRAIIESALVEGGLRGNEEYDSDDDKALEDLFPKTKKQRTA